MADSLISKLSNISGGGSADHNLLWMERLFRTAPNPIASNQAGFSNNSPYFIEGEDGSRNTFTLRTNTLKLVPRGVIALAKDLNSYYVFQFNPEDLKDKKEVTYTDRESPLRNYLKYAWTNGGSRRITFTLFVDETERYLSIKPSGSSPKAYARSNVNSPVAESSVQRVQDDIDFFNSLIRPDIQEEGGRPTFAGIQGRDFYTFRKFSPPPRIVFSYGDSIHVEGVISDLDIDVLLRDENLYPVRAKISVTIRVDEAKEPDSLAKTSIAAISISRGSLGTSANDLYAGNDSIQNNNQA
ncbi:CIS tube protein [Flammeovirga agarivorans]|uniref:Contractile injection system tube protein N-terminal domain-containing protein n=1 Tax=Flammeovirga agarivorans TaxID=2726742 RepID=A0A7X8XZA3_9BACT|nr:hypothetical protein [Flammeovirga agarivorans]NLR94863.1 hypothetical protein [Flammeovirga agarivorans]